MRSSEASEGRRESYVIFRFVGTWDEIQKAGVVLSGTDKGIPFISLWPVSEIGETISREEWMRFYDSLPHRLV